MKQEANKTQLHGDLGASQLSNKECEVERAEQYSHGFVLTQHNQNATHRDRNLVNRADHTTLGLDISGMTYVSGKITSELEKSNVSSSLVGAGVKFGSLDEG